MREKSVTERGISVNKKVVGICIPCYNEQENVVPLYHAIVDVFQNQLPEYEYLIQYIDNCSTDKTQELLRQLCSSDKRVRAIFNAKNYYGKSALHGLLQAEGDCVVYLSADFQDPVEKIPELLCEWEKGHLIVAAIKNSTKENALKRVCRNIYYDLMKKNSTVGYIEQFCNFGVYDRKFIEIISKIENPYYSIRGNVAEYGYNIATIRYDQPPRRAGKSNYNIWRLWNLAIDNFVNYTNIIPRLATVVGATLTICFLLVGLVYLISGLVNGSILNNGDVLIVISVLFVGSIQTFLLGIIGEYILSVKNKINSGPLVIERERINFGDEKER